MSKKKTNQWRTVTPLSKTLALILFVGLPFLGFYLGTQYEKAITPLTQTQTAPAFAPTPASAPSATAYQGKLPCADCEGINATLTFFMGNTYSLKYVYIGRSVEPFIEKGAWKLITGIPGNPHATVYQLNPDRPDNIQNYVVEGNQLMQLDRSFKPMTSPYNGPLTKIK